MDVDAMKPGLDFVKQLDVQVAQCDVVLAIIGANWFNAHDDKGQRRLESTHDYVRIELATALTRDTPVIPVLVDGAVLPPEEALPDDLKSLARRHALELRYTRFNSDAEGIEFALRHLLPQKKPKWFMPAAVAGGVVVACLAAILVWRMLPTPNPLPPGPGSPPIVVPQPGPAPTPPTPPSDAARRALELTGAGSVLLVSLGDSMEHVKSVYHITTEPFASGKSLGLHLPLVGIYFFFDPKDKMLNDIRVDAPFEGSVEGVHIGDPLTGIISRLGESYATPWEFGENKAYAYHIGDHIVRFDIDKAGKVATIFQFTNK